MFQWKNFPGSYDFFGLNQYSSFLVEYAEEPEIGSPSWEKDMGTRLFRDPSWRTAASEWLYVSITFSNSLKPILLMGMLRTIFLR